MITLYRLFLPQCLTAEQIPPDRQRFIGRPWLMTDERRPTASAVLGGADKGMEARRRGRGAFEEKKDINGNPC